MTKVEKTYSQFKRRIFISASKQMVYNSWMINGEMARWFTKSLSFFDKNNIPHKIGVEVQNGDHCSWSCHLEPNQAKVGVVEDVIPYVQVNFNFGQAGLINVKFEAVDSFRTQVILTQSGIPIGAIGIQEFYYSCLIGWSFWLLNLKAFLEYGITLDEESVLMESSYSIDEKEIAA